MFASEDRLERIIRRLTVLTDYIYNANAAGKLDVDRAAEDFYCGLLNIMFDSELVNMNYIKPNYPAVDLGDKKKRLSIQITATNTQDKVQSTLDKYIKYNLYKDFDRIIVLLITHKRDSYKKFRTGGKVKFTAEENIWDSARLIKEIRKMPEKYESIETYLNREIDLGQEPRTAKKLTLKDSLPPREPGRCLGREGELAELERLVAEGCNPVYIWGLGGMGKTELAIHFGQEHTGRRVHFVRFTESFRLTITSGLAKYVDGLSLTMPGSDMPRPQQEIYKDVMAVMARHRDDILIVDNVDGDLKKLLDDDYQELLQNGPRLIITTRNEKPGYVEVGPLENAVLREIFKKHQAVATEREMDDLIAAVNGHTLTIDLMARTLRGGWRPVTAKDILDALASKTLPTRISRKVGSAYRPDEEQERIYAHLRVLFNVAGIPETGREALRYATLLPEAGMDAGLFFSALPPEIDEDTMTGLSDRGWLGVGGNIATIHPVVRLVCHEELKPTDENCASFLDALWGEYSDKEFDHQKYTQMAELFATATDRLADSRGDWADHGRKLWHMVGQNDKAMTLCEKVLRIRENAAEPDLPALATAYNDMGHLHRDLGHYQRCMEYLEKALALRQEVLTEDDPDLAMAYNNISVAHSELGNYYKALEYQETALKLWERVLDPDHPDLALAYDNVGGSYGDLGDHRKELEYREKALDIRIQILPPDHPDIAISYDNVGGTYGDLGDHRKALEHKKKALDIRERILPPDHLDIAVSYNNVGSTYGALGDHRKALEHKEKALDIRKRVLPADHPDITNSYDNVGGTYGALGDYRKELKYKEKALEIRERILPPDHPKIADSYDNVGTTYGDLGDHRKELEYAEKALDIRKRILPPDHPDIALSYNNVGATYGDLGDRWKALEYVEKALEIRQRVLPPDHPAIAMSYNNVGVAYSDLGDHQKELDYTEKALEIRHRVLPPDHPDIAWSHHNVGWAWARLGDYAQALEHLRKAAEIIEKALPPGHPHIQRIKNNLAYWTKIAQMPKWKRLQMGYL